MALLAVAALMISADKPAGYKPGHVVAGFSLKNVDGRMVGPESYKNAKGYIVVFTCNHCPFAKLYQERMNQLNSKYGPKGFPLMAISANDADAVPEDDFEAMKQRAKEKHYNFPYLYDEQQALARAFGAVKTPHAFVISKENGKWILKYSGAIDDNGSEPDKVTKRFVAEAVDALLTGRAPGIMSTKSVGCAIKWKNGKYNEK